MTKKQEVMKNDPKLFKGFHDAVERGKHLRMPVFLCDNSVELYTFEDKDCQVESRPAISNVVHYQEYSQETLDNLNAMMDARADVLYNRWVPQYKKLDASAANCFAFDFTFKDYAKLFVYVGETVQRIYELDWCYDDLLNAAEYLSRHMNPDLED